MKWLIFTRRPPKDRLEWEDIEAGMTLVQFVYGIAMVLGFTSALAPAYHLVFPATRSAHLTGHKVVILMALAAIIMLGLRFFWVPRNLYSYLLQDPRNKHDVRTRLRRTAFVHVPITMAHALLFYVLCQAFSDLALSHSTFHSDLLVGLSRRFVILYALLLGLNAMWLLRMTAWPVKLMGRAAVTRSITTLTAPLRGRRMARVAIGKAGAVFESRVAQLGEATGALPAADVRSEPASDDRVGAGTLAVTAGPGTTTLEALAELIWGFNNAVFAALAGVLIGLFEIIHISTALFLLIACVLFLLNGILDLYNASEDYVVFPRAPLHPSNDSGRSEPHGGAD